MKNIRRNPKVYLNLEGATTNGGDVVIFNGIAFIEDHASEPDKRYVAKYEKATEELGRDFSEVYKEYRATLRIKPSKVRGF